MRIVNVIVYLLLIGIVIAGFVLPGEGRKDGDKWKLSIKEHLYLLGLLLMVNTISFAMTFTSGKKEIYVEKKAYGGEEQEVPFLLQEGEDSEEITLTVSARQLTKEELQKRITEAFAYLEENMKGDNESLSKVHTALNYSLDVEKFPFDAEFVSGDYALIDGEGAVKNERAYLLSLGYTKQEIESGIPITVTVTLWYGEESFQQVYSLTIFPKERSELEEKFADIKEYLGNKEKEASYDEGFYVPTTVDGVQITRLGEEAVTPLQVLVAGVVLAALLLLREKENKRKEMIYRTECLKRSYPWFVNEMVLLLGAGMQVRNILSMLTRDYENIKESDDYRKPLMEELQVAVRAMELGMSEEQAYYRLGRRLGIPCYIKIMTLLEQNVKRGGKGLTAFFEEEELQALEERKNLAKRYGEEVGTKLLGPMVLLLLIVMFMIMIPAFMGFA